MPPLPKLASANLTKFLPRLRLKPARELILHYCIARAGGDQGAPRMVLGLRATDATRAVVDRLWKGDDKLATQPMARWHLARGAIRITADGLTVVPATRDNKVLSAQILVRSWKDAKKALTGTGVDAAPLDLLARAPVARAEDTSRLVGRADDDPVEEVEPEPDAEAEPETLALDTAVDDATALRIQADFNVLSAKVTAAVRLIAGLAEDAAPQRATARKVAAALDESLRALQLRGEKREAELRAVIRGESRNAGALEVLDEISHRVQADIKRLDEAATRLVEARAATNVAAAATPEVVQALALLTASEARVNAVQTRVNRPAILDDIVARLSSTQADRRTPAVALRTSVVTARDDSLAAERALVTAATLVAPDSEEARTVAAGLARAREDVATTNAVLDLIDTRVETGTADRTVAARDALVLKYKENPAVLTNLVGRPGGNQALDRMIRSIGSRAEDQDTKDFIAAALKARFGITEVNGGAMTTKALPRLYDLMTRIPARHTLQNDSFKKIERNKGSAAQASLYSAHEKKVILNVEKTGRFADRQKIGPRGSEGSKVQVFDATSLHEIGHSVDEDLRFMSTRMGNPTFGDWRQERADVVYKLLSDHHEFHEVLPGKDKRLSVQVLQTVGSTRIGASHADVRVKLDFDRAADRPLPPDAETLLATERMVDAAPIVDELIGSDAEMNQDQMTRRNAVNGKPAGDWSTHANKCIDRAILTRTALDVTTAAYLAEMNAIQARVGDLAWDAILRHPAVTHLRKILARGDDGLWDDGNRGAAAAAIGGRVIHQSQGQWYSYPLDRRAPYRVTDYQFRAPAEWFAELYTAFYLNKLPDAHPAVAWMREHVDEAV